MNFLPLEIILNSSFKFQGPVGPDMVMVIFIAGQLLVMFFKVERDILHFIELFPMGPVATFYSTITLWLAGRVLKEQDLSSPTSLFKLIHEL
jgi:hypothetical protein